MKYLYLIKLTETKGDISSCFIKKKLYKSVFLIISFLDITSLGSLF